jgi:hypothetical protein
MRTHRYIWALASVLLASCYDYSVPDNVVHGETVYTQPDPAFTFQGNLHTYWLDTNVNVFQNSQTPTSALNLTDPQYAGVVAAIDSNMQAVGWTKSGQGPQGCSPPLCNAPGFPVPPAAGTAVVRLSLAQGTGTYWYGGYWCDPYYYYWCYYDWYYAGSYQYGTVAMTLNDFTTPVAPGTKMPIRWIAAMYGVSTSSAGTAPSAQDIARVADAIPRAFSQSPYLSIH